MYRPVNNIKKRGGNGKYTIQAGGFPNAIETKLAMTVIVKTMDSQRWVCRTHLSQLIEACSITILAPSWMASWEFRHQTAWHIRRSVAASRRTSWHPHQPYVQSAYPRGAAQGHRGRYANRQPPSR